MFTRLPVTIMETSYANSTVLSVDQNSQLPKNTSNNLDGESQFNAYLNATARFAVSYIFSVDWRSYATATVLWMVFVVGVVGNLFVLGVLVWRRKKSQIVTQLFLGSLAVADVGMLVSVTWSSAIQSMNPSWAFGLFGCRMIQMWRMITSYTSIMTLMAIAIDR